jgi:hypothetical protein
MARPLEQSGPLALLEDAAHLLRRAPLDILLCHWIGSVPLVLALLVFWNQLTHPPVPDVACAAESLAVALLLVWMSCWRAAFAGRLHRQLSGTPERPWNRRRVWRLVGNQAFLAATKLLMLPLSLAAVYPFARVVAFYRYAAVLADREDLDPLQTVSLAKSLSGIDRFQCWLLQALLLLLSMVAMLNVTLVFIALPQLVKMLTGYESVFSRAGESYVENRLFLLLVLGVTWLVFDPFVQAVYCLRCFQGESVGTGEDLRAGLRRVRAAVGKGVAAAALALALAILPVVAARAADSVAPGELERAVRQTMQSPEYNWRFPPPAESASDTPWIILATDRAIAAAQAALRWLGRALEKVLRWIFGGLGLGQGQSGQAPAAALHWSVWAMIGLALAMAGWVLWRARRLRRRKAKTAGRPSAAGVRLDDEGLTADRLPEAGWIEMAERAMAEGNLRLALRAFYLANLAWLGRHEFLGIHPGKTNREFEMELRRRAREAPEARERFSANVRAFERAWYGMHEVFHEDAIEFRQRAEEIKTLLGAAVPGKTEGAAA